MAALPKRKHSKMRKGKRMSERSVTLPQLVPCLACREPKLPHQRCKACGK
jgi:ribosomal protein L32